MHRRSRAFVLTLALGLSATGGHAEDCRRMSLAQLEASSPGGLAIYRQLDDPDVFGTWIRCDDPQFDLSTAVHESTHLVTSKIDAFPLVGGGAVRRPHEVSAFFPPYRIAKRFKADDLVTIYLRRGKASSATDFLYLLDELNAYTHDLATAIDLKGLTSADLSVDHRDGLAATMAFVSVYAETARRTEPATWAGLQTPAVAKTVTALWGQAERVLASSCGIPRFGHSDKYYIRRFCAAGPQSAIEQIIGRAPVCPTACLQETEPGETREAAEATPQAPASP